MLSLGTLFHFRAPFCPADYSLSKNVTALPTSLLVALSRLPPPLFLSSHLQIVFHQVPVQALCRPQEPAAETPLCPAAANRGPHTGAGLPPGPAAAEPPQVPQR